MHDPCNEDGPPVSMSLNGLIDNVLLSTSLDDAHGRPSFLFEPFDSDEMSAGENEVAQPDVRHREQDRYHRDDCALAGEVPERDRRAGPGGDPEDDDVGAGADRSQVAAEIRADRERPP